MMEDSSLALFGQALAEDGRTMLVVTHEMGFARNVASEVLFLRQGQIEEQGAPQELFNQPAARACNSFWQAASNRALAAPCPHIWPLPYAHV